MTLYNEAIAYNAAIPYNGSPTPPGGPPVIVPVIEVAFGTDPLTTPGTWTDISTYCKGFDIRRGKTHELASSQAGEATLVLQNTDRRFDPSYASSPYYPNVVPMRRLRVRVNYNSVNYNLFEGFVEDWGQTWPSRVQSGTGAANAVVRCVDAFKLLGLYDLTSYSAEVLADDPVGYWRLDEDQGQLVRSYGSTDAEGAYTGNVEVGTAPGPLVGGSPVPTFAGDIGDAYVDLGVPEELHLTGDLTIEAWVFPSASSGQIVQGADAYALMMNVGTVRFGHTTNGGDNEVLYDSTGTLTVGAWNHLVAVRDIAARDLIIYVNGVETARGNYSRPPGDGYALTLSQSDSALAGPLSGSSWEGKLAHVAIYDKVLDPTRIQAHASATFDTFVQQSSGTHLDQVLDLVGWPAGERNLDPGLSEVMSTIPDGNSLAWALAVAETTEQGILAMKPNGDIRFTDRQSILTKSSLATFGDGGGAEIAYSDIGVRNDDADLYSTVTVTGATQHSISDAAAVARYGPRTLEVTGSLAANEEELTDEATYLLGRYKAPAVRVESLNFIASTDGSTIVQLLTRDIGDRITVKRRPPGGGTITQDCLIEQVHHVSTPDQPWHTDWSLVPVDPMTYFRLNTSTLDGSHLLAY